METFVSAIVGAGAALLAIPVAILALEVVATFLLRRRIVEPGQSNNTRKRVAVLIPAYNESSGLLPTITDVQKQLLPGERLLVVADNCTDDTASVAFAAGAEVAERHDTSKRGKGYALEFGVRHLASNPPEIVIVIDADCRLAESTIGRLALTCGLARRPVQALYLMSAPDGLQINHRIAEFAWRVKNWIRPLGLNAMGWPCQLMGTGMAFPWDVIRNADLAHGWIVEDLKLGLDLAEAGHPPLFCSTACVTSQFASSIEGSATQRERWEHGHISTILTCAPQLLCRSIARRNWPLLALTFDLMVPPLSLLAVLLTGMLAITGLIAIASFSSVAFGISTVNLFVFLLTVFFAWLKFGREILPSSSVLSIAGYAFGKLGLYLRVLSNKIDPLWTRTDRTKSD
jgi:cellulose synthase/poly-beta-1,6-N-acetylglucosamine synthase-like glycosyltransferase